MAEPVYLRLTIDGTQIDGESTVRSMDREDTIECSSYEYELIAPRDPSSGLLSGKRQHGAVTIAKRVDQSTPLLFKALCNNESVTRAEFRFFRPSPAVRGGEEHFYTVLLENGYVSSIAQLSEDEIVGGEAAPPMMETVSFVFASITWTDEIGGATHQDQI